MSDNNSSSRHQNHNHLHNNQVLFIDVSPEATGSNFFDDDGCNKRPATVWTASAHIITVVIGTGALSLAWAFAQLGWIVGPLALLLFAFLAYYTSVMLDDCYRYGDPVTGQRNYTYMDVVRTNLGGMQVKICGWIQYLNLFGVAIGYTIAASISMMEVRRSNCFHASGGKDPCHISVNPYMIIFGVAQIIFSQIPDVDHISWLSMVAAVVSFTYSIIGLGLGIGKVVENGKLGGSLTGISIGTVSQIDKIWRTFQALGDIAFAYSYSMILIEIQDTVRSPPSESKTMKRATLISVSVTTLFYMLCGCMGYAAFGDSAPGGMQVKICGWIQYLNLFGVAIGYTITASISMMAVRRSNCFHPSGGKDPCHISVNPYMIIFGAIQIVFSQIPDLDHISWLSMVAAFMSFTYSIIGLGLEIGRVIENGKFGGSLTGNSIGTVSQIDKIWRTFQALGDIAFAYSYSMILIEIQDTVRSPPSESKTMKRATLISVAVTTLFYMLCGCMGYAAFGDSTPRNLFTGSEFYTLYWVLDVANGAIAVHLIIAYQVYCQPLFTNLEKSVGHRFPDCKFITKEIKVPIIGCKPYNLNLFRLVWRTVFVIITTIMAMLLPFEDVAGLLGAIFFWPLAIYYPVEMYIKQKRIPTWSTKWVFLQILSGSCLIISIAATTGSVAAAVNDLKSYKPFRTFP